MALTLFEDTFVTVATANTLLSGDPDWSSTTVLEQEQALRRATKVLNDLLWKSAASSGTQPLSWPRESFVFFDPSYNLDIEVTEGTIPRRLQQAVANLALHYRKYPTAITNYSQSFEKIKLGPLELEDTQTSAKVPAIPYKEVTKLVEPLLVTNGNLGWWRAN